MSPRGEGVVIPQIGGGCRRHGGVWMRGGCGDAGGGGSGGGEAVSRHWRRAFYAGRSVSVWASASLHRSRGLVRSDDPTAAASYY